MCVRNVQRILNSDIASVIIWTLFKHFSLDFDFQTVRQKCVEKKTK